MSTTDEIRARTRATWAAGDWDTFSQTIAPVGALVVERAGIEPGMHVLDVGTGSGGNVAIPAALKGAKVVGLDLTPELFEHARRRAAEAGVEVAWVEGDAEDLPFEAELFDRVISTFGAIFAPHHATAAAELVRVCRPGGRILMTAWASDGMSGGMFKLAGSFMPPPPPGIDSPQLWGDEEHIREVFAAAGATPSIARETVVVELGSEAELVAAYTEKLGPMVAARSALEAQGRWDEFVEAFRQLVHRFNTGDEQAARLPSDYYLIAVER
jgi:SAM-dependent methyltransferase